MQLLLFCYFSLLGADTAGPLTSALTVAEDELSLALKTLSQQPEPPYFVSVAVNDTVWLSLDSEDGALDEARWNHWRFLDIDLRVGSPALDNTHALRGSSDRRDDMRDAVQIPIDDAPDLALRTALRRELNRRYKDASQAILLVRSEQTVMSAEEDPAPDFEMRDPVQDRRPVQVPELDIEGWQRALLRLDRELASDSRVEYSEASLDVSVTNRGLVDTVGSHLEHGTVAIRLAVRAGAHAADGDQVDVYRYVDVHSPSRLPSPEALDRWAPALLAELHALLDAPRGEPWSGPVLLRGRAAGVFFHEVLGHRSEGHRQKLDSEGKTFKAFLGRSILPSFLSVWDDPRVEAYAGQDLNGYYHYDDEGVPAQRADLVIKGVFEGFLMGRSPLSTQAHSNGHGRRSPGYQAHARMANLVVETSTPTPFAQLKKQLIEQARAQNLPYAIIIDDIDGGFTMTGRVSPNAFNVRASAGWKVYVDGRPDERLRGIDLVGTPLTAFENLIAAGDDPSVFNGTCGAASGWVPVSAVSPSLLFGKLEFQLKEKDTDLPPVLPKPTPSKPDGDT